MSETLAPSATQVTTAFQQNRKNIILPIMIATVSTNVIGIDVAFIHYILTRAIKLTENRNLNLKF